MRSLHGSTYDESLADPERYYLRTALATRGVPPAPAREF